MDSSTRPALGQRMCVGALYNARTDNFLPDRLIDNSSLPGEAFQVTTQSATTVTVSYGDGYRKRFDTMGVPPALRGNVLADTVSCAGSSRYLAEPREARTIHAALQHTLSVCNQTLDFQYQGLRNHLTSSVISNPDVTHMVVGIEWGSKSVISVREHLNPAADLVDAEHQLHILMATFSSAVESLAGSSSSVDGDLPRMDPTSPTEISAYSEMFEDNDGILLEDLQEAYEFLQMTLLHVKGEQGGRGWPISYSMVPVDILRYLLGVQTLQLRQSNFPPPEVLDSCVSLFDDYLACERKLDSDSAHLRINAHYLPRDSQHALNDRKDRLYAAAGRFRDDFTRALASSRSGLVDSGALRLVLDQYQTNDLCPQQIGDLGDSNSATMDFILTAVASGAVYVGHNGVRLEDVLPKHPRSEAYVLYFSPAALLDETTWKPNCELLLELLGERLADTVIAIVDCEATASAPDRVRIAQIQDNQEVVEDLLAHRSFMADKSFAACDESTLETEDVMPPIQRRHVTIPCPGTKCSVAKVHEWLCPRCVAPVEYGYTDQYIYCRCGRSLFSNYDFRCSSQTHGRHYTAYESEQLLQLLNGLVQTNYINILILGETGVGKSTFINAMVNYLEFETLDEAIDAEKLNWVIPCSFSTQIMDRSNPNRPIEEKRIQIGASDDERDGSRGDSATQKTTVYPVTFRSGDSTLTVRLIDTPGIGDSRGVDADRQNMADILSTLSGYDTVHGILILLKSNNARLTVTFRYCIQELLTHLHSNAAVNMSFGFTNTRISNYTPGDTYGPLKALLDKHPDMGLRLEIPTTYCFDSESFRYLAAYKSDVMMPNKTDFDRSWSQSRDETIRLIEHFQSIPPHEVKNTISLNGARQLIAELTKPLAKISQLININIQLVEDQVDALKTTRVKGDELRNMLHVDKIQLTPEPLDYPRTVCSDKACIEVKDDGKGQNNKVIIYSQHCHPRCYLTDVQADVVAHASLINCAAFSGNYCNNCRHHWQQHLHIYYELHEEMITVVDNGIQQQLANHADDITLKQTAIVHKEQLVNEYRQEQETIRDAAAKFCVFLKNNSLAAYNDALVAYLDFLIKEEQAKVQAGGHDQRLLSLTEERHKHQEAIEVITRNMNASNDVSQDLSEGGVDRMVQSLYKLKHFGDNLRKMKQGIATAHQATYREKPYNVQRRNQPRSLGRVVERRPVGPANGQYSMRSQQMGGAHGVPMGRGNAAVLRRPHVTPSPGPGGIGSFLKKTIGF